VDEGHASVPDGEATPTVSFGTPQGSGCRAGGWVGVVLACAVALAFAGCGSSARSTTHAAAKPRSTVCLPAARVVVARSLSVSAGALSAARGTSSEAVPQCVFRAPRAKVVAIVDSGAQAYFRLERAVVEASQQFSAVRLEPAPVHVGGLGLDADWFPKEKQLETTDGVRLITVTVNWNGVPKARQIALAKATARTYLGPLDRKAAYPNGS
jgi:hypothetical protein